LPWKNLSTLIIIIIYLIFIVKPKKSKIKKKNNQQKNLVKSDVNDGMNVDNSIEPSTIEPVIESKTVSKF